MKKEIIDIDAEFDGVEFDEAQINRTTAIKNKYLSMTEEEKNKRNKSISEAKQGKESYHKGKTRPWAGKKRINKSVETHTEETKSKISKSKIGCKAWNDGIPMKENAKQKMSKIIVTPDGIFLSRGKAAEHYNVNPVVITHRCQRYPKDYYYITQEEYIMLTGKDVL